MKEYEKLITVSDCLEKPNNWMFKYLEFMTPYLKKLPKTHPDWPKMKGAL